MLKEELFLTDMHMYSIKINQDIMNLSAMHSKKALQESSLHLMEHKLLLISLSVRAKQNGMLKMDL